MAVTDDRALMIYSRVVLGVCITFALAGWAFVGFGRSDVAIQSLSGAALSGISSTMAMWARMERANLRRTEGERL